MGSGMNYDKYLQNEVLNKLKLSTKCDYNDNKQWLSARDVDNTR